MTEIGFKGSVLKAMCEIPYGRTSTYGALARHLGKPTAARAVGAIVGGNRYAIIIPCHRVIGSDGRLTGYAWGLERKRQLLAFEARHGWHL